MTKDSRDKLAMNTSEQQSEPPRNRGKDELRADVLPTGAAFVETLGWSARGRNQAFGGVHVD